LLKVVTTGYVFIEGIKHYSLTILAEISCRSDLITSSAHNMFVSLGEIPTIELKGVNELDRKEFCYYHPLSLIISRDYEVNMISCEITFN